MLHASPCIHACCRRCVAGFTVNVMLSGTTKTIAVDVDYYSCTDFLTFLSSKHKKVQLVKGFWAFGIN